MKNIELKDIVSGNCYHICTNGQETPTIIFDEEDFKVAWNYLALAGYKTGIEILAFIIMSNHVHILIIAKDRKTAIKYIRLFKRLYSTHLLHKYNMSNTLRGIEDSIYTQECPICQNSQKSGGLSMEQLSVLLQYKFFKRVHKDFRTR